MTVCDLCELEHTPELAKSLVTCVDAAELLGYEVDASHKIPSFANPDERTPSLHVYDGDGGWFDYSAGEGGDVIDFVMRATGMEFPHALNKIIHRALKAGVEPGDVERQPVKQIVDFTDEMDDLHSWDASMWPGRWRDLLGVSPPLSCRIDYDGNLLIPHADDEGVYGVKVRSVHGSKSAWPGSQFTKRLYDPYGWNWLNTGCCQFCVITEGETDCWALLGAHVAAHVFALPSGASSWKDSWLEDLAPFDTVYLCMDNDRAGKDARDKLTRKIGYLKVKQLIVPQLYNDAREAIVAGWRPRLGES